MKQLAWTLDVAKFEMYLSERLGASRFPHSDLIESFRQDADETNLGLAEYLELVRLPLWDREVWSELASPSYDDYGWVGACIYKLLLWPHLTRRTVVSAPWALRLALSANNWSQADVSRAVQGRPLLELGRASYYPEILNLVFPDSSSYWGYGWLGSSEQGELVQGLAALASWHANPPRDVLSDCRDRWFLTEDECVSVLRSAHRDAISIMQIGSTADEVLVMIGD